jgi:hypothetical protein
MLKRLIGTARRCGLALLANAQNLLATSSLLAIAVGLWWERPSLALVIPGTIIFLCLIWGRLRPEVGVDDA